MVSERFFPLIGGAEKQCFLLSKQLVKKGLDVDVVTRWIKRDTVLKEIDGGLTIFRVGLFGLTHFSDYICALGLALFLIRNRKRYQILHIHGGMANLFGSTAIIMGKILNIPSLAKVATPGEFSFTGRGSLQSKKYVNPLIKFRVHWSKKADYYVAQTQSIRDELLELGIEEKKIFTQPNGVDVEKFVPANFSKEKDKVVFLYVGRIVARKGLMEFVEVWKKLINSNKGLLWQIVGSGENQKDSVEEKLRKLIKECKLSHSVVFLGEHKDILPLLNAADVFVYPSTHPEGVANSIIEAMACCLPILATNIGGINEIITNGRNGFLANNELELYKYAKTLAESSTIREKMGEQARKGVIEKYDIKSVAVNYSKIYENILKN